MSKVLDVKREVLVKVVKESTTAGIKYEMGSKPPSMDTPWHSIDDLDCSGFARKFIHDITEGKVVMPDGSMGQRIWCQKQGFQKIAYKDCTKQGDKLIIAFMDPVKKEAGHVWFEISGLTIESRGGVGPSRRKWNTAKLLNNVDYCFVLTGELS
jgi:hypothetical protein